MYPHTKTGFVHKKTWKKSLLKFFVKTKTNELVKIKPFRLRRCSFQTNFLHLELLKRFKKTIFQNKKQVFQNVLHKTVILKFIRTCGIGRSLYEIMIVRSSQTSYNCSEYHLAFPRRLLAPLFSKAITKLSLWQHRKNLNFASAYF